MRFDYVYTSIGKLACETDVSPKTGKKVVKTVLVNDEPIVPSTRFFTSLMSRYGFNNAFFKFFNHAEVFERVATVVPNDALRVCIERDDEKGSSQLLGVSNPSKPIVLFDELGELVGRFGGNIDAYHGGVVDSSHAPTVGANDFEIGGDLFANRFIMSTPIDGYGQPSIYLSLLRQVCTNGVVGYSKAFRSFLSLGKGADDVTPSIARALEGFNSDEGYAALRNRMEIAQQSWGSVNETMELYKLLVRLHSRSLLDVSGGVMAGTDPLADLKPSSSPDGAVDIMPGEDRQVVGLPLFNSFRRLTGDPARLYGIANPDALSIKRQRTLPVKCTTYELVNFATEVASHYAQPEASRQLQGWVGTLISEDYDLEGSKQKFSDFQDFTIERKIEAGVTGSEFAGAELN